MVNDKTIKKEGNFQNELDFIAHLYAMVLKLHGNTGKLKMKMKYILSSFQEKLFYVEYTKNIIKKKCFDTKNLKIYEDVCLIHKYIHIFQNLRIIPQIIKYFILYS